MEKRVDAVVQVEDEGIRLEQFLRGRMGVTKNEVRRAKFLEEGICVNGERRKVNVLLKAGDLVEVVLEMGGRGSEGVRAFSGEVSVLYEDSDVIVADKPSGLSVHPAGRQDVDTLANRLAAYLRGKGEESVIRILGRLDKDTSGVVLAVKNRGAAVRLERQREDGQLLKSYLAFVEGVPEPGEGRIDKPLGTRAGDRRRMCVDPEGKRAVTHYALMGEDFRNNFALVRLWLETGRMHQIRVHMASIGHPLLGDPLYGNGAVPGMGRAALHAWRLRFLQPFTGEEVLVEAPVPADFLAIHCISVIE